MKNKVNCIMLVDDNADDNFVHERLIRKNDAADIIVIQDTALKALEYLQSEKTMDSPLPDLIFLDINMPGMNGWDFLDEYAGFVPGFQATCVVVMLTTSEDTAEIMKSKISPAISEFRTKPLTGLMLAEVLETYFQDNIDVEAVV